MECNIHKLLIMYEQDLSKKLENLFIEIKSNIL